MAGETFMAEVRRRLEALERRAGITPPPPDPAREARLVLRRKVHRQCVETLAEVRRRSPRSWRKVLRATRASWTKEYGPEEAERSIADLLRNMDAEDRAPAAAKAGEATISKAEGACAEQ